MGTSISWMVVASKSREATLAALDLQDTGESVAEGEYELAGGLLPDGGYLIVMKGFWHPLIHPDALTSISAGARVVGCSAAESVNTSLAFLYRDGAPAWQVSHILDEGADHFDVVGHPPREYRALLKQAQRQREAEGYDAVFDVPAQLASLLCGYQHGRRQLVGLTRLRSRRAVTKALTLLRGLVGRARKPPPLPNSLDEVKTLLKNRLASFLEPLGFQSSRYAWGGLYLERVSKEVKIEIFISAYGFFPEYTSDVFICVRHPAVHRVLLECPMQRDCERTAFLALSKLERRNALMIESQADVDALFAFLQRYLPPLIERCEDTKALDKLVNEDRSEIAWDDRLAGNAALVLAYLAGNPHFENMLATSDALLIKDPDDPVGPLVRLGEYLRAQVPFGGG